MIKTTHFIIVMLLVILCSSCYSYKVYPKGYRNLSNDNPKPKAYVLNDSLKKEMDIMVSSDLFQIVQNSTHADVQLQLYPLESSLVCGQPLTISMLTLGQLPVVLPDTYVYRFDEIAKDSLTEHQLSLQIGKRVWFWDFLVFNKKFEEKAGKAVLGAYLNKKL